MDQTWVRNYIEKYLEIHQCHFIEKEKGHLTVKLSADVDKDITNRPYYWAFVERTGVEPETLTMSFIFQPDHVPDGFRGEEISFGSERMKQFFSSAKKHGRAVRLFQQFPQDNYSRRLPQMRSLNPWLGVNFKVDFISDKKKNRIISLGINLANGQMKEDFHSFLHTVALGPVLPANVTTTRNFITFREAALQLEEWLLHEVSKENFQWVVEANERLAEEIHQIEIYYAYTSKPNEEEKRSEDSSEEDLKNQLVEKEKRLEEVKWQYSPRIEIKPINFGIFYLDTLVQKNVEYKH